MKVIFPIVIALLAGCATTTPETHYYLLSSDIGEFKSVESQQPVLYLQRIVLAEHLNQQALVMLKDDHNVSVANYHFWAQPLDAGIEQVIEYELNQQCGCEILLARRGESRPEKAITVEIFIEHLSVNKQGKAMLAGVYSLQGKGKQRQRFYLTDRLSQPGYSMAVAKYRQLLSRLADDIARYYIN